MKALPEGRTRFALGCRWLALLFGACLLATTPIVACAQSQAAALHEVEAAYILKFTSFVQWPANTFASDTSPIVLGVLDDPPLARTLERAVRGRQTHGRAFRVRLLQPTDRLSGVHVLVLPPAGSPDLVRVMKEAASQPILTIQLPASGGSNLPSRPTVRLVLEDERMRFDVNVPPRSQGLHISALMLTAARRVARSRE